MTTRWIVAVSYPGYNVELDKRMENVVGKDRSGSGYGMGYRDMDWEFDKQEDAEKAVAALRGTSFGGGITVSISQENGNDTNHA